MMPEPILRRDMPAQTPRETHWPDLVVYALIVFLGGLEIVGYTHTPDFVVDPGYPDLARSILEHHSYQFDFLPMTTLPPGLPLILALVGRFFGLGPAVEFRVIAISTTLGLLFAYLLLRRIEGRGVGAAACLLLGSSPLLFGFSTTIIFPEMPYVAASMFALWLTVKIDRDRPGSATLLWALLLGVVFAMATLIRSVGIALIAGLGAWIFTSLFVAPETGRRRLKTFLLPLLLSAAVQLSWSAWAGRHQVLEWQLPGYPQSYVSQIAVKNGQYPELGMASLSDIPSRVERNLITRAAGFGQIMTRRYMSPFWSSPAIAGVLALILLGLAVSFRQGGELHDWYFLGYEAIFLIWPWDYRDRFVFPIVPLACLYLWRGVKTLRSESARKPKVVGLCLMLGGVLLSVVSAAFAFRIFTFVSDGSHLRGDHLQPLAAVLFWAMLAAMGAILVWFIRPDRDSPDDAPRSRWVEAIARPETARAFRFAAVFVLAILVGMGVKIQLAEARFNLHADVKQQASYGEIQAAEWIRAHEPSDRVIMARDQDMFFHYTGWRRVVWFPPISNPQVLMEGIRRHHVSLIVVVNPPLMYWLPTEDVCFQVLQRAYGSAFHLVQSDPNYQLYDVEPFSQATSNAPEDHL